MTKIKAKTAADLGSILDHLREKIGSLPWESSPAYFSLFLHDASIQDIARRFKEEPGGDNITLNEAETLAGEIKGALKDIVNKEVERRVEKRLARLRLPGEYPLSRELFEQTISPLVKDLERLEFSCDEHKMKLGHRKIEHVLLCLHEEASEEKNPKRPGYFMGNHYVPPKEDEQAEEKEDEQAEVLASQQIKVEVKNTKGEVLKDSDGAPLTRTLPVGKSTLAAKDIFRFFYGKKKITKWDEDRVVGILDDYAKRQFMWIAEREGADGQNIRMEIAAPRMQIAKISKGEKGKERLVAVQITLHPAFLSMLGLEDTYIKIPKAKLLILEAAAGGANKLTNAHVILFDFLTAARGVAEGEEKAVAKKEIGFSALIERLDLSNYLKNRNAGKLKTALSSLIEDMKKTGLLRNYEKRSGLKGEVCTFLVNRYPKWLEISEA